MRAPTGCIGLAFAAIVAFAACTAGGGAGASAGSATSALPSAEGPSAVASAAPSVDASVEPSAAATAAASAETGSSSGPCALVTAEEVAQITGVEVTATEADERSCVYETPTSHAIVALVQRTTEGAAELYADFASSPEATPVSDLGDEAVWLPAMEAVQLHVLQGDDLLSLAVGTLSGVPVDELTGASPEVLLDMATQLGETAVGRL
jgi:hypothetical protein